MTHKDIYTKFMIEYDKANETSSYPSLTEYEVAVVLDKAYNALIAQKVTGNNPRRVGFEQDVKAIEDLSPLVVYSTLTGSLNATNVASNVIKFTMPEHLYFVAGYLSKTCDQEANRNNGRIKTPRRKNTTSETVAQYELGDYGDMFNKYYVNGELLLYGLQDDYWYIPWEQFKLYVTETPQTSTVKMYYYENNNVDVLMPFTYYFMCADEDSAPAGGPGIDYVSVSAGGSGIPISGYEQVNPNDVDLHGLLESINYWYERDIEDLTKDFYIAITPASSYDSTQHNSLSIERTTVVLNAGQTTPTVIDEYVVYDSWDQPKDDDESTTGTGIPIDNETERSLPISLVTHQIAQQFFATAYNIPWIKNPVCYIESEKVGDKYKDKLYVVYDSWDQPKKDSINIVYIKKPNSFVKTLPSDPNTYMSFFDPGTLTDTSAYEFELNDTMAEELISLAVTFALENIESPRLNSKLNMRGLEA